MCQQHFSQRKHFSQSSNKFRSAWQPAQWALSLVVVFVVIEFFFLFKIIFIFVEEFLVRAHGL